MEWIPANPVEEALRDALARGDEQRYLAVLAESMLLVSVLVEEGADRPSLGTMRLEDGAEVVPAYTSPEAMSRPEAEVLTEQQLAMPFAELVAHWPGPAYALAVNPGLPIAAHVAGAELPMLVGTVFTPVNELERRIAAAHGPADVLSALMTGELLLPVSGTTDLRDPSFEWWRGLSGVDDFTAVPVFTSPERLHGCLGLVKPDRILVDLPTLASVWPGPQWLLSVNPTSPYSVTFTGEQLQRLVSTYHRGT
jgi:hypothetical protein